MLAAAVATGCEPATAIRPGDIRTYTIAKDAEPTAAPAPASPAPPPAAAAARAAEVRYEVPEGWNDGGASGMRLATLFIGAPDDKREVTVIPASGTLESNVERWQGQLDADADAGTLASKAREAIAAAETIDVAGTAAKLVLLRDATAAGSANEGEAILAAVIPLDDKRSLFVKFKGDAAVAARERERFAEFVLSIRWQEQ
jgi:hypothetical protein